MIMHSIEKVKKEQMTVQQRKNEIYQILNEKRIFDEQLVAEQNSIQLIEKRMKEHRSKFRWENFDPDNPAEFKKKVEQAGVLNRRIDVIEKEVREKRKELEIGRAHSELQSRGHLVCRLL